MGNKGIPGFVIDVNMDEKVQLLEAEFGNVGFAILIKLWMRIYGQNYYIKWNDEINLLFAKNTVHESPTLVSDIVKTAVKREIFNKEMYEKYGILTSKRIQETFFKYCERRKKIDIVEDYLLTFDILKNPNVCILGKNVLQNQKNVCNIEQIKSNQIKLKDKTIDKVFSNNFLTNLLIKNKLIADDDIDLEKFNDLFNKALDENSRNDCSKVTNYIIQHSIKNLDNIQNIFAYFKKSFEDGLKNLIDSRIPKGDFIKDVTKKFKVAEGGKIL